MIKLNLNTVIEATNKAEAIATVTPFDDAFIVTFSGHQSEANKRVFCQAITEAAYNALNSETCRYNSTTRYEDINILVESRGVYEYPIVKFSFEEGELDIRIVAWMSNFRGKAFQVSQTIDGQCDMGSSEPVDFGMVLDHLKKIILAGQHDTALLRFTGTVYYDERSVIAGSMMYLQHGMRDIIIKAICQ